MEAIHHVQFKGYTPDLCVTVMLLDLTPSLHLSQTSDKCHFASGWLMFIKPRSIWSSSIKKITAETLWFNHVCLWYPSSFMGTLTKTPIKHTYISSLHITTCIYESTDGGPLCWHTRSVDLWVAIKAALRDHGSKARPEPHKHHHVSTFAHDWPSYLHTRMH